MNIALIIVGFILALVGFKLGPFGPDVDESSPFQFYGSAIVCAIGIMSAIVGLVLEAI